MEHSDWVAQKRDEARLALTIELRREMEHARTRGDERRVVLYANQLLQADPLDVDALRERVRAAAAGARRPSWRATRPSWAGSFTRQVTTARSERASRADSITG
ncbi:hypothetical protein ACFOUS_20490 [Deinococcus metalli]|uniref:hypothetical protein n=1 Tax=Deinococcus metalli TaxID=1141878 RepID=UPI0036198E83